MSAGKILKWTSEEDEVMHQMVSYYFFTHLK